MISIIGIAGSGKNTQADLITKRLKWPNFDAGTLLRQKATGKARQQLEAGELVDDSVTIPILTAELKRLSAEYEDCILVGSPRSLEQAKWLADEVKSGKLDCKAIIHLDLDKETARQRLLKRGRSDDARMVINQRFTEYDTRMGPVLEYLDQHGLKIVHIDASNSIEAVYKAIIKSLNAA